MTVEPYEAVADAYLEGETAEAAGTIYQTGESTYQFEFTPPATKPIKLAPADEALAAALDMLAGKPVETDWDELSSKINSSTSRPLWGNSDPLTPTAPKPMTWPDGVDHVRMGVGPTVTVCKGFIDTTGIDDVSFTAEQARQFAALLLAAADKVEGRG